MRKIVFALGLLCSMSLTSCLAGPHQLNRTVDDWDRKVYVDSPWLNAVLWIVPVFPLAHFGAAIGDFLICDAYAFWLKDAFGGKGGTGFVHADVSAERTMKSLLRDDGKFLEITGGM
jgi:hypothetical protein